MPPPRGQCGGGSSEAGEGVRRGAAVTEASALGPSAPCVCGQHEFYRSDSDSIARSCFGLILQELHCTMMETRWFLGNI